MPDLVIKPEGSADPSTYTILPDQTGSAQFDGLTPDTTYRVGQIAWDDDTVTTLPPPPGEIMATITPFTSALFDGQAIDDMRNALGESFLSMRQPANFYATGDTILSVDVLTPDLSTPVDPALAQTLGALIEITLRVRSAGGLERLYPLQAQSVQAAQAIAVENVSLLPTGELEFSLNTDGSVFILINQSAAPLAGATVKAGGGALDFGPYTVSGGPVQQSLDLTGLQATTGYFMHIAACTNSGEFSNDVVLPFTTAVAPDSIANIVRTTAGYTVWTPTNSAAPLIGASADGDEMDGITSADGTLDLELRAGSAKPVWDQGLGLARYTIYGATLGASGLVDRQASMYFAMVMQRVGGFAGQAGTLLFSDTAGTRRSVGSYRSSGNAMLENISGTPPVIRVDGTIVSGAQSTLLDALTIDQKHVVEVIGLNMLDPEWSAFQIGSSVGTLRNSNLHGDFILLPTPTLALQAILRAELAARHGVLLS